MGVFNAISKKKNFTFAVAVYTLVWVLCAVSLGYPLAYLFMKNQFMELFYLVIKITLCTNPILYFIHLSLVGMIEPLTLKSLRPINKNIIGDELSPNITYKQIQETLAALKVFPRINATIAAIECALVVLSLPVLYHYLGYGPVLVFAGVVVGLLLIIVYTFLTHYFTDVKVGEVRRRANRMKMHLRPKSARAW
ncbi:MAG: hypothetical protein HF978_21490 [Desulfobacteraceae bacterium]|nr:hypothetical protein [Desulfobacteraceae bacterium]MBC2758121.1 hypothetical protein [Desulfobacteraceae bacterium]